MQSQDLVNVAMSCDAIIAARTQARSHAHLKSYITSGNFQSDLKEEEGINYLQHINTHNTVL